MSYLTVAISVLSVLVTIYRQFWSDSAQLKSLELKLAALKERQAVEAERLKATYARIEAGPSIEEGDALATALNEAEKKLHDDAR